MDNESKHKSINKFVKRKLRNDASPTRKLPTLPEMNMDQQREDRFSVDSAYYGTQDEAESLSRPSSQKHWKENDNPYIPRRSPSPGRRWLSVVDTLRQKRKADGMSGKSKSTELNKLKEFLRRNQAALRKLESEQIPVKEKNKVYETKIMLLENKLKETQNEMRDVEIVSNEKIIQLEKELQTISNNNELLQFQLHKNLQDNNKSLLAENKMLQKEMHLLNEEISSWNKQQSLNDDEDVRTKQLANLKGELLKVKQLLEASECERLNERKEKLSAVQSMVRLTKLKSELEEEIDERRKADSYYGNGEKYTRLFEKYEKLVAQVSKLRENEVDATLEIEKKYIEEIHELKRAHGNDVATLKTEHSKEENHVNNDHLNLFIEDVMQDVPEIIPQLKNEGIFLPGETAKEVLTKMFHQYQELVKEFESSRDLINSFQDDDARKIVQVLKEERRVLKQCLSDSNEKVESLENDLRVKDTVFKNQINNLLAEKKKSHLELQKTLDEVDVIREEKEELEKELQNKQSFIDRKLKELDDFRENLLQATSEMKTIDAEHVRSKRELAMKDAEISRITQDFMNEQIQNQKIEKNSKKLAKDLEDATAELKIKEKNLTLLQEKIFDIEAELGSYKTQHDRLIAEKDEVNATNSDLKKEIFELNSELRKSDDDIESLKVQNSALEASTRDKIKVITNISGELDNVSVELLALKHLLTEEETKCKQYEEDIDKLTEELEKQNQSLLELQETNRETEQELNSYKENFEKIEADFDKTESESYTLQQSKLDLEKKLNDLTRAHNEFMKENKRLKEKLEELQENIFDDNKQTKEWQSKYDANVKDMKKKNEDIVKTKLERDKLLQENNLLTDENNELKTKVSFFENSQVDWKNEKKSLKDEIKCLEEKDDEKQEEIDELKSQIEILTLDLTTANSHIDQLKKHFSNTEAVISNVDEHIDEVVVESNLESGVDMFTEYSDEYLNNQNTNGHWNQLSKMENVVLRLKNAEKQVADMKKENENLKEKMNCKEKEMDENILQKQVDILVEATNSLMSKNQEKSRDVNSSWDEQQANQRWNELLLKEHQIDKLNAQLEIKNDNIESLEKQIESLEEKIRFLDDSNIKHSTPKKQKNLEQQVENERRERVEAIECLKAMVEDNDKLTASLLQQKAKVERKERENDKLKNKINELMSSLDQTSRALEETKEKLALSHSSNNAMKKENGKVTLQQSEIEFLRNDLEEAREDKRKLQQLLEDKKMELTKAEDELRSLRNVVEYNLGCLEAEKRSKDLMEEQFGLIVQDRTSFSQKLESTQLQNKLLMAKLKSLQKWHSDLQVSLIRSSTNPPTTKYPSDYFKKEDDALQERNIYKENEKVSRMKNFNIKSIGNIALKM